MRAHFTNPVFGCVPVPGAGRNVRTLSTSMRVVRELMLTGLSGLLIATTMAAEPAAISTAARPSRSGSGRSQAPVWSADGRSVAFVSRANNLVALDGPAPHWDVFVRELGADGAEARTELISVAGGDVPGSGGASGGANGASLEPVLSADGLVVAFQSDASNLVAGDGNGATDVFVRDRRTGVTRLVSVTPDGLAGGNGPSWGPSLSADGRYVIFESRASNLVTNDFNGATDVFVRDLEAGVTRLVSINAAGTASADGPSESPSISTNGRVVAFASNGANLVPGATNRLGEIYVRDWAAGVTRWATASHVLQARDSATLAYGGYEPALSGDGRYVAFKTRSGAVLRFDTNRDTNTVFQEFFNSGSFSTYFLLEDNPRVAGRVGTNAPPPLSFSADGRYLAFITGPAVQPSHQYQLYRADCESWTTNVVVIPVSGGAAASYMTNVTPEARLVSRAAVVGSEIPADGRVTAATLSADGALAAFVSSGSNLIAPGTRGRFQLYVRDLAAGVTSLISTNRLGAGTEGSPLSGIGLALDARGHRLAFDTPDSLVADDLNGAPDVYVQDLTMGRIELISEVAPGRGATTPARRSEIRPNGLSADGRLLAYTTLDRGDPRSGPITNVNPVVRLAATDGGPVPTLPGSGAVFEYAPVLSADGRYLAWFRGYPSNFLGSYTLTVVRRDLVTGAEREFLSPLVPSVLFGGLASAGGLLHDQWSHDLSRDGRFLAAVYGASPGSTAFVACHDLDTGAVIPVSRTPAGDAVLASNPVFSPDGRWVAFVSSSTTLTPEALPGLFVWDRINDRVRWLSEGVAGMRLTNSFAFSADGRWIVFHRAGGSVVLQDLAADTNYVVTTRGWNPSVNRDGLLVACESMSASRPGVRDVVVHDVVTGSVRLASRSRTGANGGDADSTGPVLSADGRFVAFASKASDLVAGDTNGDQDVFVRDLLLGTTVLVSINRTGTASAHGASSRPIFGADGRTLIFHSVAGDLGPGVVDENRQRDVYLVRLGGRDTDGDGLDDDWEMTNFDGLGRDGSGDADADGASDRDEFLAGTSPILGQSFLRALTLTTVGGAGVGEGVQIIWTAVPGRSYRVEFRDALDGGTWTGLGGTVTAIAETAAAVDAHGGGNTGQRYYRVRLEP